MRVEVEELQQLSVESQASARRSAPLERGEVGFEHLISLIYNFSQNTISIRGRR